MDEFTDGADYGGDHDDGDSLECWAFLPSIAGAVKAHGDGSGGRMQWDIPETDKAALAWAMLRCPGKRVKLRMTIYDD